MPILGYCAGSADAISACIWTPQTAEEGSNGGGKKKKGTAAKGEQQTQQRFTVIF